MVCPLLSKVSWDLSWVFHEYFDVTLVDNLDEVRGDGGGTRGTLVSNIRNSKHKDLGPRYGTVYHVRVTYKEFTHLITYSR